MTATSEEKSPKNPSKGPEQRQKRVPKTPKKMKAHKKGVRETGENKGEAI